MSDYMPRTKREQEERRKGIAAFTSVMDLAVLVGIVGALLWFGWAHGDVALLVAGLAWLHRGRS